LPYRYSSVRHSHITEEIKKTISTNQAEVNGAITTTDKQLIILENKVEELNLSGDDEEAAGTEGKAEALRQLEEERKALNASRKLLDELLSKSQEEAVAKAAARSQSSSTTVTFGNQNSGFQAGIINGAVSGISFGGK
jgi:pyruvate-formate lyase